MVAGASPVKNAVAVFVIMVTATLLIKNVFAKIGLSLSWMAAAIVAVVIFLASVIAYTRM